MYISKYHFIYNTWRYALEIFCNRLFDYDAISVL